MFRTASPPSAPATTNDLLSTPRSYPVIGGLITSTFLLVVPVGCSGRPAGPAPRSRTSSSSRLLVVRRRDETQDVTHEIDTPPHVGYGRDRPPEIVSRAHSELYNCIQGRVWSKVVRHWKP